jgi:alpha-L-fucosidase
MDGQLCELLTEYGPVGLVWFDGGGKTYDGQRFLDLIHHLQLATLVNDRIGVEGDYVTFEQFIPDRIPTKSNAKNMRELMRSHAPAPSSLPAANDFQPWETCMTLNGTWAYNKNDTSYKSSKELIRDLVDVASKAGNFLLDVGPTPEGTIHGDSIYGTTYGPLQNLPYGKTTAKGNLVYLHVFDWPVEGRLEVPGLQGRVAQVTLLGDKKGLRFLRENDKLIIQVPSTAPDPNDSVLRIVLR